MISDNYILFKDKIDKEGPFLKALDTVSHEVTSIYHNDLLNRHEASYNFLKAKRRQNDLLILCVTSVESFSVYIED